MSETSDAPPTLAGDHADDDPQVLEDLIRQDDSPPKPSELPKRADNVVTKLAPVANRLMTQTLVIPASSEWAPIMALPADPRRTLLNIAVTSETSTDYLQLTDDPGKLSSVNGAASLYAGTDVQFSGDGCFRGPVWVKAKPSTAHTIVIMAVTS